MASAYSTIMRHIDEWQWGPVILLAFAINPRSGPPDFSIDVTKEGHWSLIPVRATTGSRPRVMRPSLPSSW